MDPIADLLTTIRNAYLARKSTTSIPHSRLKHNLAQILAKAGYISGVTTTSDKARKYIHVTLRYVGKQAAINGLIRVSTPGRRLYVRANKIKPVLGGQGLTIISTSQGLKTDAEAKKLELGGEIVCKVW